MALSSVAPAKRRVARRSSEISGYIFILPYTIGLLVFGLFPALYAVYMTFFYDMNSDQQTFQGFANYTAAFRDFRFWPSFANVLVYLIVWLPITVVLVLFLALLLHGRLGRFGGIMRLIYYLPGAVSGSASAILWIFMFDPQVSPFGGILHLLGWNILGDVLDPPHVPWLLTIIAFSIGAGGWIVVMYGALQNISTELIEAARIDGSGPIQMALRIKLPLISKYVVYMLILSFAGGMQIFVEPQLLGVASGKKISPTWSPNQLAYEFGFNLGNLGASAVISLFLLAIGLIGALLIVFRTNFFSTETLK